jgi:DNA mismatch endonuclease (patch repair protein)
VFIHGCFWHGHNGCKYYVVPKTRTEWWLEKINKNVNNDNKAETCLLAKGWRIFTIWECDLKPDRFDSTMDSLRRNIISIPS